MNTEIGSPADKPKKIATISHTIRPKRNEFDSADAGKTLNRKSVVLLTENAIRRKKNRKHKTRKSCKSSILLKKK